MSQNVSDLDFCSTPERSCLYVNVTCFRWIWTCSLQNSCGTPVVQTGPTAVKHSKPNDTDQVLL
jgi:hypothetical protein